MNIRRFWNWYFIAPAAIVGVAALVAVGGTIVRLLWNWLLPPLTGWSEITFWQALGLLALCRILFGGFGFRGGGPSPQMSPEHREHFRQRMRERLCRAPGENPESDVSQS